MNEAKILEELRRIECAMSPENLAQDGERSPDQARAAYAYQKKKRDEFVAALGREPTSEELYPRTT